MNDEREWNGVTERRSPGDRREKNTAHVSIDELSNGARSLMERAIAAGESAVDEARKTRWWFVGSLSLLGLFLIGAGELRQRVETGFEIRPTDATVLKMFAERDSALIKVIHEQQITLEVIGERQKATTRRLDLTEAELERIRNRLNGQLEGGVP